MNVASVVCRDSPNAVAERLTGRPYLSHSAISTFHACPLRWHFRYVEGLPEGAVSPSLVFGAAIHRAVELHYRASLQGDAPPGLDGLLAAYHDEWRAHEGEEVRYSRGEDQGTLGDLAGRVLQSFLKSPLNEPMGRIVGVEEELTGMLAPDCPDLLARIDLLVDDGRGLVITDLKTSRSRWSPSHAEDSAEQLLLYGELARNLLPGAELRLRFLVVTKGREPTLESHEIRFDERRRQRTLRVFERTWRAMSTGHVYPTPSAATCCGCPFRSPCRDWQGDSHRPLWRSST